MPDASLIPTERIEKAILVIRDQKVILDHDLAKLYDVPVKRLNEQVRRNIKRFPEDFMFQISREELESLRSQIATLKAGRGQHRKYLPSAFTEQGIAMLSSVLNSDRAIAVNIAIMRAFVRLWEMIVSHKDLAGKLDQLEKKYDNSFRIVFEAIRKLMEPPPPPPRRPRIGFGAGQ